jgi:hypothetical protein
MASNETASTAAAEVVWLTVRLLRVVGAGTTVARSGSPMPPWTILRDATPPPHDRCADRTAR